LSFENNNQIVKAKPHDVLAGAPRVMGNCQQKKNCLKPLLLMCLKLYVKEQQRMSENPIKFMEEQ